MRRVGWQAKDGGCQPARPSSNDGRGLASHILANNAGRTVSPQAPAAFRSVRAMDALRGRVCVAAGYPSQEAASSTGFLTSRVASSGAPQTLVEACPHHSIPRCVSGSILLFAAEVGENRTIARQRRSGDEFLGVPEIGTHRCARALEVDRFDGNHDN